MQINDCSRSGLLECTAQVAAGEENKVFTIASEHWIQVFVNEQPAMRVVCTPEHLDELVVGRLLTEGIIDSPQDIELLYICEQGLRAKVLLREGAFQTLAPAEDTVNSCCTDNRTLLSRKTDLVPVKPIPWRKEWLLQIAERMRGEEPLYEATHAVHACYLAMEGEVLCCREDLGRHNALDKVIGWACIHGVELGRCVLFTTGRMPSDMVSKAVRSGVPVMASKTYPSNLGVELAKEKGLTLITVKGRDQVTVWNNGMEAENNTSAE